MRRYARLARSTSASIAANLVCHVERCIFNANSGGLGGALAIARSVTLKDCLFEANAASSAGGCGAVNVDGNAHLDVQGCTIVGNRATISPLGGIGFYIFNGGTIDVTNSILSDNDGSGGARGRAIR